MVALNDVITSLRNIMRFRDEKLAANNEFNNLPYDVKVTPEKAQWNPGVEELKFKYSSQDEAMKRLAELEDHSQKNLKPDEESEKNFLRGYREGLKRDALHYVVYNIEQSLGDDSNLREKFYGKRIEDLTIEEKETIANKGPNAIRRGLTALEGKPSLAYQEKLHYDIYSTFEMINLKTAGYEIPRLRDLIIEAIEETGTMKREDIQYLKQPTLEIENPNLQKFRKTIYSFCDYANIYIFRAFTSEVIKYPSEESRNIFYGKLDKALERVVDKFQDSEGSIGKQGEGPKEISMAAWECLKSRYNKYSEKSAVSGFLEDVYYDAIGIVKLKERSKLFNEYKNLTIQEIKEMGKTLKGNSPDEQMQKEVLQALYNTKRASQLKHEIVMPQK
jgi:hypothetical protein